MHRFYRRRISAGLQENEVEALQTDVMRFIAILGICLMVIFALVQSLPVSSQGNQPKIYNKEIMQRQVDDLSRKLAAQQKDLRVVSQVIEERKKTLERYNKELRQAKSEYLHARRKLDAAEKEIKSEQAKLKDVVSNVGKAREHAESLKVILDGLWKKVADKKTTKTSASAHRTKYSHVPSPREGFVLRFSSESALERLVGNNRVRFYMISGGKSWRLDGRDGSTWRFHSIKRLDMPKQVYQLRGVQDVPEGFVMAGKKVVADFSGPEYYVWLPPDMRKKITGIMEERKNGEIEIGKSGNVSVQ